MIKICFCFWEYPGNITVLLDLPQVSLLRSATWSGSTSCRGSWPPTGSPPTRDRCLRLLSRVILLRSTTLRPRPTPPRSPPSSTRSAVRLTCEGIDLDRLRSCVELLEVFEGAPAMEKLPDRLCQWSNKPEWECNKLSTSNSPSETSRGREKQPARESHSWSMERRGPGFLGLQDPLCPNSEVRPQLHRLHFDCNFPNYSNISNISIVVISTSVTRSQPLDFPWKMLKSQLLSQQFWDIPIFSYFIPN